MLPYLKKAGHILDLGCGNGRFVRFLQQEKLTCHYLGVDNSRELIKIAQKKHPNHHFVQGDQLKIPAEDETTDLVLSIRAFHHLPSQKTRNRALQEIRRVLSKNGTIIISVWNLWQIKYWKQLAAAFALCIFTLGSYAFNDTFIPWKKKEKRYYHAFTKHELRQLLIKNNFTILDLIQVGKDIIIIAKK